LQTRIYVIITLLQLCIDDYNFTFDKNWHVSISTEFIVSLVDEIREMIFSDSKSKWHQITTIFIENKGANDY